MADEIYGGFGGIDCVVPNLSVTESASGAIAGFSFATIYCPNGAGFTVPLFDPADGSQVDLTNFWTHFVRRRDNTGGASSTVEWRKSDGTAVMRMLNSSTPDAFSFQLQVLLGGVWTDVPGAEVSEGSLQNRQIDVFANFSVSGKIALFIDQGLVAEVDADYSGIDAVSTLWCGADGFYTGAWYQQGIIANFNTLGHTVRQRGATANGSEQDWSGTYANIDEFPFSDSDFISSGTADQKSTFEGTTLSATPTGQIIKGVFAGARCRIDSTGPQNVATIMQIGSVDYVSPYPIADIKLGYSGGINTFMKNPATNAAWASITEANCDFGIESQA